MKKFNACLSLAEIKHAYKSRNDMGAMCFLCNGVEGIRLLSTQNAELIKTENEKGVQVE